MIGRVFQINVKPKDGSGIGIPKRCVDSVHVSKLHVGSDFNVYRFTAKYNTRDRAVLIHCFEVLEQVVTEGWPVQAGDLGENFTLVGIDY